MVSTRPPGSINYLIDLHIHTPQSSDYKDKGATGTDIVKSALDAGLNAIAVTDHNDYRFISEVQEAAKETHLVVFGGVEISTRNGHLLAIFNPEQGEDAVRGLLEEYRISGSKLGAEDTLCDATIENVASTTKNRGGIAIAAHIDGKKGFIQSVEVGQARKRIHSHEDIEALELVDAEKKKDWVEGKVYPKARACIQGSDAHSLNDIGKRPTKIKVSELSVEGLRQAFKDPETRIRFGQELEASYPTSYIEKLEISQGFFNGLEIRFNPGLNCLIGGQGVGKSAVIEFMRFCLNDVSSVKAIRLDHESKIEHLLKTGGSVSVTIRNSDGSRFIVKRVYDEYENPITIKKIMDDGSVEDYDVPDIGRYFSILAYSQGEAAIVARDTVKQLELIDDHLDLSSEREKLHQLTHALTENTSQLQNLDRRLSDVEDLNSQQLVLSKELKEIEDKLKAIEAGKKEPAIRNHQSWNTEQAYLRSITSGLEELQETVKRLFEQVLEDPAFHKIELELPNTNLGNKRELKAVQSEALRTRKYLQELAKESAIRLQEILANSRNSAPNWVQGYNQHKEEHAEALERLGDIEVGTLQTKQRKKSDELAKVTHSLKTANTREQQKQNLMKTRNIALNQIEAERHRIAAKREKQAKEMSKMLEGRVSIKIVHNGNTDPFFEWMIVNIRNASFQKQHVEKLVANILPRELADKIRDKDTDYLCEKTSLSSSVIDNLLHIFVSEPSLVYQLEEVQLEDKPTIRMKIKDGEQYRPLEHLSTGQKFTVIILLALIEDVKPIIYDQPEDALDTSLIYTDIAKILRQSKENRQFIFATHNSNMSVAADLDLAIIIESSSTQAEVAKSGGLEEKEVKELLVTYLEGGNEALQQRVRKSLCAIMDETTSPSKFSVELKGGEQETRACQKIVNRIQKSSQSPNVGVSQSSINGRLCWKRSNVGMVN